MRPRCGGHGREMAETSAVCCFGVFFCVPKVGALPGAAWLCSGSSALTSTASANMPSF